MIERQILSCDLMVVQVNEYPWIAAFDLSGVDGANPGGCAATLVRSHIFYTFISEEEM